jgi:hypothetical protein
MTEEMMLELNQAIGEVDSIGVYSDDSSDNNFDQRDKLKEEVEANYIEAYVPTIEEGAVAFRAVDGDEGDFEESIADDIFQDDAITSSNVIPEQDHSTLVIKCSNAGGSALSVTDCTKALNDALEVHNQKMYARTKAVLQIPEEEYSEEKLDEVVNFAKTYTAYSETVGTSSLIVSTTHCIEEGCVYLKSQAIDFAIHGRGFKKRLPVMFPDTPESTIYARMKIAKIEGVYNWAFCGTERLRDLARAIKIKKVQGTDQIAELIELCGVEYDADSMNYAEINSLLDTVIETVLHKPDESSVDSKPYTEVTTEKGDSVDPETNTESDNGEEGSGDSETNTEVEGSDNNETHTDSSTEDESSGNSEDYVEITTVDENSEDSGSGKEIITENGETITPGDNDEEDKGNKRFLSQESINITLAKFVRTVGKLLELQPPKDNLDLEMFKQARSCLDDLENYVTSQPGH